jgi:hypothetical protein
MPRRGRIRMVGKWEAREAEARAEEMLELERDLRRQWRRRRTVEREVVAEEPAGAA